MAQRRSPKAEQNRYDTATAEKYWTKRLRSTDPLAAVLTYDALPEANSAYDTWERQSLLRLLKSPLRKKKVLDIGCGTGRIALMLASKGAVVTAADVSKAMLDYCQKEARRQRVASRVTYLHCPAHNIPCPSNHFDIITCFGLLEHLPALSRQACLTQATRALAPNGLLYIIVNNSHNLFLKQKYRSKQRKSCGYFAGLVGLNWLQRACKKLNLSINLKAANPFYGLVHYHLLPNRKLVSLSSQECAAIFRLAIELDLKQPLNGPLYLSLASHFMVEITHTQTNR